MEGLYTFLRGFFYIQYYAEILGSMKARIVSPPLFVKGRNTKKSIKRGKWESFWMETKINLKKNIETFLEYTLISFAHHDSFIYRNCE